MLIFVSKGSADSAELARRADVVLAAAGKPLIGKIRKNTSGAPLCENYNISVAHTNGVSLLAASSRPIGIDVEKSDRVPQLRGWDTEQWTAYEAVCKMRGDGIRISEVRQGTDWRDKVKFHGFLQGYTIAVAGGDDDVFAAWI